MAKATGKKKVFRKKEKKNVPSGIAHVAASFNNTMISITDLEGNLIAQSSAGARVFVAHAKGRRLPHSRLPMRPRRKRTKRECNSVKCVLRDQAGDASRRFVRLPMRESESRPFATRRPFRTMDVAAETAQSLTDF